MIYLQETTWTDGTPNHTYIFKDKKSMKCIGYIPENGKTIVMFDKPMSFDKKRRTFKEVKL